MKHRTIWIVLCVYLPLNEVVAFGFSAVLRPEIFPAGGPIATRCQSKRDDDSSSGEAGMEDAFRQLEQLISSENDQFDGLLERKKKDESSSKEIRELILPILAEGPKTNMMSETALFKDMFSEFSEMTETDMIAKLKNEMAGLPLDSTGSDARKSETEIFMEVALDQALKEAQIEAPTGINKASLLENKEIMKEIAMIFERANEELMDGIEEIRREQVRSAQNNGKEGYDNLTLSFICN